MHGVQLLNPYSVHLCYFTLNDYSKHAQSQRGLNESITFFHLYNRLYKISMIQHLTLKSLIAKTNRNYTVIVFPFVRHQ